MLNQPCARRPPSHLLLLSSRAALEEKRLERRGLGLRGRPQRRACRQRRRRRRRRRRRVRRRRRGACRPCRCRAAVRQQDLRRGWVCGRTAVAHAASPCLGSPRPSLAPPPRSRKSGHAPHPRPQPHRPLHATRSVLPRAQNFRAPSTPALQPDPGVQTEPGRNAHRVHQVGGAGPCRFGVHPKRIQHTAHSAPARAPPVGRRPTWRRSWPR